MQPLIAPLYDGKAASEVLSAIQGHAEKSGHDLAQDYWKAQKNDKTFNAFWETALHDGVVTEEMASAKSAATKPRPESLPAPVTLAPDALEIVFRPDPTIYDGRFSNNGWLQEAPKPITKLTWDNTAQLSPATAQKLGVANGDVVHVLLNESRRRSARVDRARPGE